MAVRTDVTIDWSVSPRIITVLSPSTEIVMQDLVDTLRQAEDEISNIAYPKLLNAEGKASLNPAGTKKVGITALLQDALLAFEARPGPTWVQCYARDGNLVAFDANGDQLAVATLPTNYVNIQVELDVSPALIESGTSGLTVTEAEQLDDIARMHGVGADPTVHSDTQISSGSLDVLVEPDTPDPGKVRLTKQ